MTAGYSREFNGARVIPLPVIPSGHGNEAVFKPGTCTVCLFKFPTRVYETFALLSLPFLGRPFLLSSCQIRASRDSPCGVHQSIFHARRSDGRMGADGWMPYPVLRNCKEIVGRAKST